MDLIEATKKAILGILTESTNAKLDINKIAEFLKEEVKVLTTSEYTCSWYELDKDLAIFVGWTDGYDPNDEDYIHAKDDPTFVLAAKIASTHEYMKTDLDWLTQPYYEDGEVWDTEITLTETSNFKADADWFIKSYKGIRKALDNGELLLENKKQEARREPEINNKVAPRDRRPSFERGSPNYTSPDEITYKYNLEYARNAEPKRYRVRSRQQAQNRENVGKLDFAGTDDMMNFEKTGFADEYDMNKTSREYRDLKNHIKANQQVLDNHYKNPEKNPNLNVDGIKRDITNDKRRATRIYNKAMNKNIESKQLKTEATTNLDDMYDEYKEAYHKDLDIKTVPCVIARDKMLSGWGRAKNTTHYQIVLCADDIEANNIASNMEIKAKSDGLANIRVDFGIKIPRNGSVSYSVGRNARAWNMSDSWYKRYDRPAEKKEEARSHKEDNEKVAPRTTIRNGKEVKITDIQKDLDNTFIGKKYVKGAVANNPYYGGQYYGTTDAEYRSKRNKTGQKRTSNIDMSKRYDVYKADTFETPVTDYQFAMDRYKSYEKTGNEDMPIAQSYKKSAQDIVNKERERIANKSTENKKVTEATLNLDDMYDEYKKAYNKDLDTKRVPCVIARDVMLSGWGGAEGKNHYQVVLCADTTEARNIEYNMRAKAKQEQLANVRTSIGIQLPRNASVAYTVGRYAPAWNMGDSWYESRFGKVEEGRYKLDVVKYNMLHDKFKNDKRSYDELSDAEKQELDTYRDLTKKVYNSTRDHKDIKSEAIETQDIQSHTTAGDNEDERAYYGKNLTKRDKIRSLDQAKRNLARANKGDERVQAKQVYDQVSYDNLPDSKLDAYKYNKDLAKKAKERGDDFWEKEHNDTAKSFAKDMKYRHIARQANKKQEDVLKLSNKMKQIDINKSDNDIDEDETVDVKSKYGNMKSIKVNKNNLSVTPSIARKINVKQEARNPENDKVNAMIRTTLNGSTKYIKDLEDLGFVLDRYGSNGKVSSIHHKDNDEYLYRGKMMGLDKNADLYNYLTKKRPINWDDRTNSGFDVQKNMSSKKDLADGGYSSNGFTTTVGKSIPKRFKTNKSSIAVTEPYGSENVKKYKKINADIASKKADIKEIQDDVDGLYDDVSVKQNNIVNAQNDINQLEKDKQALLQKTEALSRDDYIRIENEPRTENYKKGLKIRDEIVNAWKKGDLKTAYDKWSELYDLFSTGYDDEGNQTADWSEEQSARDIIELTAITDTIEDNCVYDVTDYGKEKAYKEMGY